MKTKTLTVQITVPEDYDLGPVTHRFEEVLAAIIGTASEEPEVPADVRCESLQYTMEVAP